jgi:hypothetical protein
MSCGRSELSLAGIGQGTNRMMEGGVGEPETQERRAVARPQAIELYTFRRIGV